VAVAFDGSHVSNNIDNTSVSKSAQPVSVLSPSNDSNLQPADMEATRTEYTPPPVANFASNSGTCHVQVLRSVGSWSIGTSVTEKSIQNAWCTAITNANHFVYIENQFFIGHCGNEKTALNSIPSTLLERIVKAARNNEAFRAIVLIPQHPQGDIAFTMRPRIILHYQCQTIFKGITSMIERFKTLCPGVDIKKYLDFFCLHNYGILEEKFVHDQIYIHDKFLCVDDRILIVGSANINDRSMLGERDSEVALRIEDSNIKTITMAGRNFSVGSLPHRIRTQLMRQHIGDYKCEVNLDDMISEDVYDIGWRVPAMNNASHYSAIDGDRDVFHLRNASIEPYKSSLLQYKNPSLDNANVQRAIDSERGGIKGTLYPWPMTLLKDEDLSPSLAVRSVVPSALWV
jgi:phosphatidylserine/phosphatidylglycerophosphate/cardiolipin synthase-like enzyme